TTTGIIKTAAGVLPASLVFALAGWFANGAGAEQPLAAKAEQANRNDVERVGSLVKPHGNEWRWLQIAWEPVPMKGFQRAGREGKPVVSYGRYAGVPFGAG